MFGSGVNCSAGLSWEHGCLTGIAQKIRVSVHTVGVAVCKADCK